MPNGGELYHHRIAEIMAPRLLGVRPFPKQMVDVLSIWPMEQTVGTRI